MATYLTPAELLPQTPPMLLVDEVVEYAFPHAAARVRIRPDSPFVEDGKVPALVALEYMAQAVGVIVGYQSLARGEPIRIGFLLGTRELSLEVDHFEVGDELIAEADHLFGDRTLGSFKCTVSLRGQVVASAQVSAFRSDDEEVPDP
jgi:predicted hotdog family 3-hydroxylacyl-ACP dehydratase